LLTSHGDNMENVKYQRAVRKIAWNLNNIEDLNLFGASTLLAILYNKDKKVTFEDLFKEREKMPHMK
jgi:hypothetical protein